MYYTAFVNIPIKLEIDASNEEEAKKKIYNNLISTNQIKPADWIEIKISSEANRNWSKSIREDMV